LITGLVIGNEDEDLLIEIEDETVCDKDSGEKEVGAAFKLS
jgi:hypothetical protein